jgi:hypothetical protein
MLAWDAQRFLAPYVEVFVEELVAHARRTYPGRDLMRRTRHLRRPKDPIG